MVQDDLNELYTGEEIYSHYVYSTIFSYIWVVLMYSTGLPILYLFTFCFLIGMYWVYKIYLFKSYRKTTNFNEGIPMMLNWYLTVGIVLHMVFGSFMISNAQIVAPGSKLETYRDSASDLISYLYARYYESTTAELFVIVSILIGIVMCVKSCCFNLISGYLEPCTAWMAKCLLCQWVPEEELAEVLSDNFYTELKPPALLALYEKSLRELKDHEDLVKKNGIPYFDGPDTEGAKTNVAGVTQSFKQRITDI